MKHINIKIFGHVQGVFFRVNTQKKANALNLKGFVCNQKNGSVYIEAEGKKESLQKLLDWCQNGPVFSKVEKVEYEFIDDLNNFQEFEIRY